MLQSFKSRVLACECLCGTHTAMNSHVAAEILASLGYDFLWIDTEHTALSFEDVYAQLVAAKLGGTPAVVRVQMDDYNNVKRVLEMGPDGIIFPMVNTPEQAERVIKSCMYPPAGTRGFGPLRAVRWGLDDTDAYIARENDRLVRFIQIETEEAVKNLPKIVENPYIDGYIFGPCDLSGSAGELGNVFGDKNLALIRESIAILKEHGKCIGVSTGSCDPDVLRRWHELGINLISSGVDYDYIMRGARDNLTNLRKLQRTF